MRGNSRQREDFRGSKNSGVSGKRTFWSVIAAIAGTLVTVIAGLATVTNDIPKLWNATKSFINLNGSDKVPDLTLIDARRVSAQIGGEFGTWREPGETLEVLVEALVSMQPLRQCAADLDAARGTGYYQALNREGKEDLVDVNGYPLVRFKFYLPVVPFPTKALMRIRCDRYVSHWAPVDWPPL
jgi:hypothetical protein